VKLRNDEERATKAVVFDVGEVLIVLFTDAAQLQHDINTLLKRVNHASVNAR
jgi:TusA-related sulfurtransferase